MTLPISNGGDATTDVKRKRLKDYCRETWEMRSKITVEPFVMCYILPSVLVGLAVQNMCLEKSCIVNLKYSTDTCRHIMQSTANHSEEERNAQRMVSTMTAWSQPVQTAVPGVLALFLGAWSDRTGNRKLLMVLPVIGKIVAIVGLILSAIYFDQVGLNVTAIIEGVPPALAGGRVAMTMAVYSYITDITRESERTFRIGIVTAVFTLSRTIGQSLSGYFTHIYGYYSIFLVSCVFYVFGFVYISVRLKTKPKKTVDNDEKQGCLSMISVGDLVATFKVAFRTRDGTRRLQIFLILLADMLIVGPVVGEAQIAFWFTRYKFQFTEVDYSLFLTYSLLINVTGSIVIIYVFTKRWNMEDSVIGVIACVSRMVASIVYALAPTRTIYFLGPVLDMFSSAGATSLRSMATKIVQNDEMGKTSSLIGISEALISILSSPLYSFLYNSTLNYFAGAFHLISAALAVPAIVINIILYCLQKNEMKKTREHPT